MTTKLTALIPCKNELANIRACIDSVRPIADEILIADSGSTDGTLATVRAMPECRIIEREYINSANFKNWAIPQARHPWVLIVDADERVTSELAAEIRGVLVAPPADIDGYLMNRKNHFLGYHIAHCGWSSDNVLRLFRRDVGRYHNRWVHADVNIPRHRVRRLKNRLLHYTATSSEQHWGKLNRYATWGALNYRDKGRRTNFPSMVLHPILRFIQLYVFRLGFLDGIPGLQVCAHTSFYVFLKHARLWELQQQAKRGSVAANAPEAMPAPDVIRFPAKESQPARKSRAA
jgi:glycosyltransferase involved in cell wall biosynthesis